MSAVMATAAAVIVGLYISDGRRTGALPLRCRALAGVLALAGRVLAGALALAGRVLPLALGLLPALLCWNGTLPKIPCSRITSQRIVASLPWT